MSQSNRYQSQYGGLWPDLHVFDQVLAERRERGMVTEEDASMVQSWRQSGYVQISNAVPASIIDEILAEQDRAWQSADSGYRVQTGHSDYTRPTPDLRYVTGCRLLDVYAKMDSALAAIFSKKIQHFLRLVFDRDILAFQSLSFETGSQQAIHQDTAYVVTASPLEFAGVWIALEDIEEGSGELSYYEGSHRLPEFDFGKGTKHWDVGRDGNPIHDRFLKSLHEKSKESGLPLRKFRPKKGDALIWHADLAHGGSPLTHPNPQVTRRSLVTHLCPVDVDPNYYSFALDRRTKVKFREGCYYSSYHYPLAPETSFVAPAVQSVVAAPPDRNAFVDNAWVGRMKPLIPRQIKSLVRKQLARGS